MLFEIDVKVWKWLILFRFHLLSSRQRSQQGVLIGIFQIAANGQTARQASKAHWKWLELLAQVHRRAFQAGVGIRITSRSLRSGCAQSAGDLQILRADTSIAKGRRGVVIPALNPSAFQNQRQGSHLNYSLVTFCIAADLALLRPAVILKHVWQ
jgi:hypothetical protein